MKIAISILTLFITTFTFSQCEEIEKNKYGWYNVDDKIFEKDSTATEWFYVDADTTQYCCDIKKIDKYSKAILSKVKDQIINRADEKFYNALTFNEIIVYYHDYQKVIDYDNTKFELDKVGSITYKISYTYNYTEKINYSFELGVDKEGNIFSKQMFPNLKTNPNALNLIDPCEAIKIVQKDKKFKKKYIESISLIYDETSNEFLWLVKEDGEKKINKKRIDFEKWYDYTSLSYFISNTGSIIKVNENNHRAIYCGIKVKRKRKK